MHYCTALSLYITVNATNKDVDSALVFMSGNKQIVDLTKDSILIKFKNDNETNTVKLQVENYFPYYLIVNRTRHKYDITLIAGYDPINIYNNIYRKNKRIQIGSVNKWLKNSNIYTPILNGQSIIVPIFLPESNSLFFDFLTLKINKYQSPLKEIPLEITVIKSKPKIIYDQIIDSDEKSVERLFIDTIYINRKGYISCPVQIKVEECFLIILRYPFNELLAMEYSDPAYLGINKRKLFKRSRLNYLNLGYHKLSKNESLKNIKLPISKYKNEPISIQFNFK